MRLVAAFSLVMALVLALAAAASSVAATTAGGLERQRLPAKAAALLAQAQAAEKDVTYGTDEATLREIEARFIAALEIAPRNRMLRAGLAEFYRHHGILFEMPNAALLERVRVDADPSGLVLALVGWRADGLQGELAQVLLLAALARQPQQPVLWFELAGRTYDTAVRAAYLAEAAARARALGPPEAVAARTLAAAQIGDLLTNGLFEDALAEMERLPEGTRRALEDGPVPWVSFDVLGLRLVASEHDLRPDLAVAEAVAGDPRRAAAHIAGLPWHLRLASSTAPSNATLRAALVHCAIGDVPGDPFRFVAAALTAPSNGDDALLNSAAGWRLIAAIAHRRGARHLEARALENLGAFGQACDDCDPAWPAALAPPSAVIARSATLRAEVDHRIQQAADDRMALLREIDARDRLASARGRRPRAGTVFTERRLPALDTEVEDDSDEPGDLNVASAEAPDLNVASAEAPGARDLADHGPTAVVVDRADLDPAGALWLELQRASGASEAVFTGLSTRRYSVVRHPELPLLDGETVQIEAQDRESDAPEDLEPGGSHVLLLARLADLRADSDGDGVTDVVEARWLTDPENADTDGDGLSDAVDPSPLVPGGRASPLAEPLALVLAQIFGMTVEVQTANRPPSCCQALVLPTEIVVAPRTMLAGVAGAARLLVLSPLEHEARPEEARRRGATVLSLVYFDDALEHGIIEWHRDDSGGTVRVERRADGWHAITVADWFTVS